MSALRLRRLWLAYAWPFRFAHKPLCDRFAGDVLRVGRLHLCRGCTFLYAGLAASAATLVTIRPESAAVAVLLGAVGAVCAIGSHPGLYGRWPRAVRDALRFATGTLPALAVALCAAGALFLGAFACTALTVLYVAYARARSRHRARACEGCPELGAEGVCSGFALQAAAMRAYDERCAEELGGFVPSIARRR